MALSSVNNKVEEKNQQFNIRKEHNGALLRQGVFSTFPTPQILRFMIEYSQ